jgi:hypothetical protein
MWCYHFVAPALGIVEKCKEYRGVIIQYDSPILVNGVDGVLVRSDSPRASESWWWGFMIADGVGFTSPIYEEISEEAQGK